MQERAELIKETPPEKWKAKGVKKRPHEPKTDKKKRPERHGKLREETEPDTPDSWIRQQDRWNGVGCELAFRGERDEAGLTATPQENMETMNLSLWAKASSWSNLDISEEEWDRIVFTQRSTLADLETASLAIYHGTTGHWERDILQDLKTSFSRIGYSLPSTSPSDSWKRTGNPRQIGYILFRFFAKKQPLKGTFELKELYLTREVEVEEEEEELAKERSQPPARWKRKRAD